MDGCWEYHTEQNVRCKSQDPMIWFQSYVGYNTESTKQADKTNKQNSETQTKQYGWLPEVKGVEKGKGDQKNGDGRFNFGCWTHNAICRWYIIDCVLKHI